MNNRIDRSPAERIREVVIATRAAHAMAVNYDATPTTADAMASFCACMMRSGIPGVKAHATCEEIMKASSPRGPVIDQSTTNQLAA